MRLTLISFVPRHLCSTKPHVRGGAFLARYSAPTRHAYACDLRMVRLVSPAQPHRVWGAATARRCSAAHEMEEVPRSGQGHRRAPAVDPRRLLPRGSDRRTPGAFGARVRASPQDLRRVRNSGPGSMELGAFIAQGAAAGITDHTLACLLGLLGLRVGEACSINIEDLAFDAGTYRHRCRQGIQARRHPPAGPRRPRRRPGRRRPQRWTATAVPIGTTARPPRRHPHRPPPRQARRDRPTHLPPLATTQLHHRRPRRWRPAP